MKLYFLVLFLMTLLLVGVINLINFTGKSENSLVFVAVVVRSADKTLSHNETYPTDPHKDNDYYPYGRGQITSQSLKKIFNIGKELKAKYSNFLGEEFHPKILSATSTSTLTTQLSMQTLLAGLFPPSNQQKIVENLNWQPIFYKTIPIDEDDMLAFWGKCKDFQSNVKKNRRFFNTVEVQEFTKKYESMFQYITKNSGERVSKLLDAVAYYYILQSQEKFGLKLPDWTKKQVYPENLRTIVSEHWRILAANKDAVKLTSGKLLSTIINEFQRISNESSSLEKKILLFTGYDYTLNGLLASLRMKQDYLFDTGAFISLELHKIGKEYFVKAFYQNGYNPVLIEKTIGECTPFCSLEQIVVMTEKYFTDESMYC